MQFNIKNDKNFNKLQSKLTIKSCKSFSYFKLKYEYLKNTAKINLATSRVDFVKSSDGWRVIEQNQKK